MITDKTLVVWASPANLTQGGGSALSIDDMKSHFDGIVFAELTPATWMAGSNFFSRTQKAQGDYPRETASSGTFVQVAIVYRGKQITIYRNGEEYANYAMGSNPMPFGLDSVVVFGRRHIDAGDEKRFAGEIDDARIYDAALDSKTIASLKPNAPSSPEPWAWWTFEKGRVDDRMGRFDNILLTGGASVVDGKLVLDGETGTMVAATDGKLIRKLAEQTKVRADQDLIEASRDFRLEMLADPYRPAYHFVTPEGLCRPFDPNGALFWKGRYHLCYIYQDAGSHYWGHVSSTDLLHWRHHPPALGPGEGDDGIFSGGAFIDMNGVATITYWGLGTPGGICIATSTDDNLDVWTKSPHNPVIPQTHGGYAVYNDGTPDQVLYGAADPSAIWIHDGRYYLMTGNLLVLNEYGKNRNQPEHLGDTTYLFVSDDLVHWEYLHPFYQSDRKWTREDEDNMCPDFFPLGDRHMLLFISHNLGCQYYIGRYENDLFHPETHGRMTWVDNAFFAPESLVDDTGRRIMWAWIFDQGYGNARSGSGWSGTMSLPRELWLGDDKTLRMGPADELKRLRHNARKHTALEIPADSELPLDDVRGNCIELALEMVPDGATRFGAKICCSPDGQEQTVVYYDATDKKLAIDTHNSSLDGGPKTTEAGPLELNPGEPLKLRVFIDKSVVEIFANDRQAVMRRIYPTQKKTSSFSFPRQARSGVPRVREDSLGVILFSTGGPTHVPTLETWDMMPSNPY